MFYVFIALLQVVSDDKRSDLIARKEEHNANIVEMNNDLNALEGIKIISSKIKVKKTWR